MEVRWEVPGVQAGQQVVTRVSWSTICIACSRHQPRAAPPLPPGHADTGSRNLRKLQCQYFTIESQEPVISRIDFFAHSFYLSWVWYHTYIYMPCVLYGTRGQWQWGWEAQDLNLWHCCVMFHISIGNLTQSLHLDIKRLWSRIAWALFFFKF